MFGSLMFFVVGHLEFGTLLPDATSRACTVHGRDSGEDVENRLLVLL